MTTKSKHFLQRRLPGALSVIGVLSGCGGGDGSEPILVAKAVTSYDITGTANGQKKALSAAGVEILDTQCYTANRASGSDRAGSEAPTTLLYVYEIHARDLGAAAAIGLVPDYSAAGYSPTAVACTTPPDTPAGDVQPNDTPVDPPTQGG